MKIEQFQVNTKFLNSLPPEWSKFVTDVKLVKDFYTTSCDQLHAYLEQHELHANEVYLLSKRIQDPLAFAIAFLTVVASSRFPSTNNQLRTSLDLRNQATIQDSKVTVQQVQRRQGQSYYGTGYKSNATSSDGNNTGWYKDKAMLAEAQKARQIMDEEQLAFLVDPRVSDGQAVQTLIPNNAAFQTEDLDTYDFNCDAISNAKAVLMANISNYGSDVISESLKMIDSQMSDMIKEKLALKEQVDSLEQNLSKQIKENECLLQTFTIFKSESKEKEDEYMENKLI
nr:hypothetical protein [Tanacetum cinerariifolium]